MNDRRRVYISVTRLGEFKPIGFILGSYLIITEGFHTFGLLNSMDKFQHKFC
jgi:hypothetical protein